MDTWLVDTLPPNVFYTPVQGGFYVNDTIRYTSAYFAGELSGPVLCSTSYCPARSHLPIGAASLRLAQASESGEGRRLCLQPELYPYPVLPVFDLRGLDRKTAHRAGIVLTTGDQPGYLCGRRRARAAHTL